MKYSKILLLALFCQLTAVCFAQTGRIWYVDDTQDRNVGEGTEQNPFGDLQHALDRAEENDTIFILPGTYQAEPTKYTEELCGNCEQHRTKVNATRGFLISGKSLNIIGSGKDQTYLVTNAGYGILFENSRGSLITRLKVTGGKRDSDGNATDAAVVAKYSTVAIKDVEVSDNTDIADGVVVGIGGIFGRENSEILVSNNEIKNNGWDGIALYRGATAYITDNNISNGRGAGIGITWDATAIVYRNRISGYWKGIGTFGNSRAVVKNNLVMDNLGWGIIATGTSYMDVSNNVIFHNGNCGFAVWSAECKGICTNNIITENGWKEQWVCPCVGIWATDVNPNFSISYNDVWNNAAGNYKDMPDLTEQNGNLSVDPLFQDKINFLLNPNSPLLDKGNPLLIDPDGSVSDFGAYGGPNARR